MEITVSVIIPAYNAAAFIEKTLESVASQNRLPNEIVIVDDGSSDNTYQVVTEWRSNHQNIPVKIFHQNNQGVSSARNLAISNASKEFLAFLDSDDLWLPDHLETLVRGVEKVPDCVIVFADQSIFCEDKILSDSFLSDKPVITLPFESIDDFRIISSSIWNTLINGNYIPTSASMVKRKETLCVGGFDCSLKTSEDRHFLLKLSRLGKIGYFNKVIAQKRLHNANLTHDKNSLDVAKNAVFIIEKILDKIDSFSLSPEEYKVTEKALDTAILNYLYISSRGGALNYFRALVWVAKLGRKQYKYFGNFKLYLIAFFNSFE